MGYALKIPFLEFEGNNASLLCPLPHLMPELSLVILDEMSSPWSL